MKCLPKLVITDIDGVWTDGGMYYDNLGNESKKFNTNDSAGILFLSFLDIPVAIISGENTEIVRRRADKLGISHLYLGVKNKVQVAQKLCEELDVLLSEVAFIGDDINDIPLLKKVGLSATPHNAPKYVKDVVDLKLNINGGDGAFREFVEVIINKFSDINIVLERYYKSLNKRLDE
tara:strand:- start:1351 stop:1881 length:531 start_codon:yes stop_codon:yes gene_type:complete